MVVASTGVFIKQKTAYEVRISDWSSDVCASDLGRKRGRPAKIPAATPRTLEFDYSAAAAPAAPTIISSHLAPAKTTDVYDSYWRFAAERQRIFYRRALGSPWPWTDNPVMAVFKFTNAYRASDRVSQYLIRHVIYRGDLPASIDEVVFRILLFKLFNKIETWEKLEGALGSVRSEEHTSELQSLMRISYA